MTSAGRREWIVGGRNRNVQALSYGYQHSIDSLFTRCGRVGQRFSRSICACSDERSRRGGIVARRRSSRVRVMRATACSNRRQRGSKRPPSAPERGRARALAHGSGSARVVRKQVFLYAVLEQHKLFDSESDEQSLQHLGWVTRTLPRGGAGSVSNVFFRENIYGRRPIGNLSVLRHEEVDPGPLPAARRQLRGHDAQIFRRQIVEIVPGENKIVTYVFAAAVRQHSGEIRCRQRPLRSRAEQQGAETVGKIVEEQACLESTEESQFSFRRRTQIQNRTSRCLAQSLGNERNDSGTKTLRLITVLRVLVVDI